MTRGDSEGRTRRPRRENGARSASEGPTPPTPILVQPLGFTAENAEDAEGDRKGSFTTEAERSQREGGGLVWHALGSARAWMGVRITSSDHAHPERRACHTELVP